MLGKRLGLEDGTVFVGLEDGIPGAVDTRAVGTGPALGATTIGILRTAGGIPRVFGTGSAFGAATASCVGST